MSRIPLADEEFDPTDDTDHPYLDDTDFDDHYEELDFESDLDPFETDDPTIEDEQDYGL